MRSGQSATPVPLLIDLHLVPLLITLVHAMSDDDFLCAGLPVHSDSSEDFVMGVPDPRRRGALSPASAESGGMMKNLLRLPRISSLQEEDLVMVMVCGDADAQLRKG